MLAKEPKIESKKYREWVASLPCIDCGIEDDTIIAHHLRGGVAPYLVAPLERQTIILLCLCVTSTIWICTTVTLSYLTCRPIGY